MNVWRECKKDQCKVSHSKVGINVNFGTVKSISMPDLYKCKCSQCKVRQCQFGQCNTIAAKLKPTIILLLFAGWPSKSRSGLRLRHLSRKEAKARPGVRRFHELWQKRFNFYPHWKFPTSNHHRAAGGSPSMYISVSFAESRIESVFQYLLLSPFYQSWGYRRNHQGIAPFNALYTLGLKLTLYPNIP